MWGEVHKRKPKTIRHVKYRNIPVFESTQQHKSDISATTFKVHLLNHSFNVCSYPLAIGDLLIFSIPAKMNIC